MMTFHFVVYFFPFLGRNQLPYDECEALLWKQTQKTKVFDFFHIFRYQISSIFVWHRTQTGPVSDMNHGGKMSHWENCMNIWQEIQCHWLRALVCDFTVISWTFKATCALSCCYVQSLVCFCVLLYWQRLPAQPWYAALKCLFRGESCRNHQSADIIPAAE